MWNIVRSSSSIFHISSGQDRISSIKNLVFPNSAAINSRRERYPVILSTNLAEGLLLSFTVIISGGPLIIFHMSSSFSLTTSLQMMLTISRAWHVFSTGPTLSPGSTVNESWYILRENINIRKKGKKKERKEKKENCVAYIIIFQYVQLYKPWGT